VDMKWIENNWVTVGLLALTVALILAAAYSN
jgi:hypothetical protein